MEGATARPADASSEQHSTRAGGVAETSRGQLMRAVVRDQFGSPEDVVRLEEVPKPVPADDEVLVRVHAASLNRGDWYAVTGRPWVGRTSMGLRRPKERLLGADFAGTVEAVGSGVTDFVPGDEVFGARTGALAEYVRARKAVARKPANATFEQAAAVPIAGITALQGLRDKGGLEPGQHVLINGASGGVGTFAVQIAKALGAEVTGVCHTRNVELVRELGADHVIDYTREDFTTGDRRYDLMLDVAGSKPWSAVKRVLQPEATLVIVGAPTGTRLLGPLSHIVKVKLRSLGGNRKAVFFIAKLNRPDLEFLRELVEAGKITPFIDRQYELSEAADAFEYMGEGHCRSKIVVTI